MSSLVLRRQKNKRKKSPKGGGRIMKNTIVSLLAIIMIAGMGVGFSEETQKSEEFSDYSGETYMMTFACRLKKDGAVLHWVESEVIGMYMNMARFRILKLEHELMSGYLQSLDYRETGKQETGERELSFGLGDGHVKYHDSQEWKDMAKEMGMDVPEPPINMGVLDLSYMFRDNDKNKAVDYAKITFDEYMIVGFVKTAEGSGEIALKKHLPEANKTFAHLNGIVFQYVSEILSTMQNEKPEPGPNGFNFEVRSQVLNKVLDVTPWHDRRDMIVINSKAIDKDDHFVSSILLDVNALNGKEKRTVKELLKIVKQGRR